MSSLLTPQQIASYHRDGYIIVKNFCSKQEVDKMYSTALKDKAMERKGKERNKGKGRKGKAGQGKARPGQVKPIQ